MFTTFRGGQSGAWRVVVDRAGEGRAASAGAVAVGGAFRGHRAAAVAVADLVAAGRGRQPSALCRAAEKTQLEAAQAGLGRPEASCAALIPIRKSAAWWELTQEERRRIFEDQSHHIATSLKYLPMIARQLYHCRDLGEPFDFLAWFEYAPQNAMFFEDLVKVLRATEEWTYVEREVDVRLVREI